MPLKTDCKKYRLHSFTTLIQESNISEVLEILKQKSSCVLNFKHSFLTSLISNQQNNHSTQVVRFCNNVLPGCSINSIHLTGTYISQQKQSSMTGIHQKFATQGNFTLTKFIAMTDGWQSETTSSQGYLLAVKISNYPQYMILNKMLLLSPSALSVMREGTGWYLLLSDIRRPDTKCQTRFKDFLTYILFLFTTCLEAC